MRQLIRSHWLKHVHTQAIFTVLIVGICCCSICYNIHVCLVHFEINIYLSIFWIKADSIGVEFLAPCEGALFVIELLLLAYIYSCCVIPHILICSPKHLKWQSKQLFLPVETPLMTGEATNMPVKALDHLGHNILDHVFVALTTLAHCIHKLEFLSHFCFCENHFQRIPTFQTRLLPPNWMNTSALAILKRYSPCKNKYIYMEM